MYETSYISKSYNTYRDVYTDLGLSSIN